MRQQRSVPLPLVTGTWHNLTKHKKALVRCSFQKISSNLASPPNLLFPFPNEKIHEMSTTILWFRIIFQKNVYTFFFLFSFFFFFWQKGSTKQSVWLVTLQNYPNSSSKVFQWWRYLIEWSYTKLNHAATI